MKKTAPQTLTALPPSPDEERRARVAKYTIAMSLRMVCVLACFFLQGWWLLLAVAGAVFLPYFAVVAANTVTRRGGATVLRPGTLVRSPSAGE